MALRTETGALQSYQVVEASGTNVGVPDATLMFTGEYSRVGSDLVLTGSDGAKFVVTDYFNTDSPPSLISPDGATLTGHVVTSLAGPQFPGQFAQAGGSANQGSEAIGKVQTLEGSATVVRANGVTETLKIGDPVFQGDVVMTGPASKLGISFLDGTLFSLSNNARMVLSKLVYDPDGSDNSMLFSLVEGTFVFAAGKIAPTGDMRVETPAVTIGVRGTTTIVDINSILGAVDLKLIPDFGTENIGTIVALDGDVPIGTLHSDSVKWVIQFNSGDIVEIPKEPGEDDWAKTAMDSLSTHVASQSDPGQQAPSSSGTNSQPPSEGPDGNGGEGDNGDGGTLNDDQSGIQPGTQQSTTTTEQTIVDDEQETQQEETQEEVETVVNASPAIAGDLGITVDEAGTVGITTGDLTENDPDDDGAGLTYTVTTGPANGQLELTTNPGVAITSFTQAQLAGGLVVYVHDGSETTSDSFGVSLADGGEDGSTPATATIDVTVNPVNEPPAIGGDLSITVDEAGTVGINTTDLTENDPDDDGADLTYTVTTGPANGQLELTTNAGVAITSFTQADLAAGLVVYVHNGTETTSDAFEVSLSDGSALATATIDVTVNPVNDPPAVVGDLSITVDEAGTVGITTTDLTENDPDDDGAGLTYTVTTGPANGHLELTTNPEVPITSFTQAQLAAGLVVYIHNGSETTSDSFIVSLADGGEDGATPATATVDVTVNPVNDPPAVVGDLSITVDEAGTVGITTTDLTENDPDDDGADLTYTVTTGPANGHLELTTSPEVPITSFTQAQLAAGLVVYIHNGSETTGDSFGVSLADGGEDGATPATATIEVTVNPVNDPPVGVPAITGTVTEDETLTADTSGISDAEGLGPFSYQWLRGGEPIEGATGSSYTLGDDDVGAQISVQVSYTDLQGTPESVTSAQTAAVVNVNDTPVIDDTNSDVAGAVTEDTLLQATGTLIASDPDNAVPLSWSLQGAAYSFAIDQFSVVKNNTEFFTDNFDNGNPPPDGGLFPNGSVASYGTSGVFIEAGGQAIMNGALAGPTNSELFGSSGTLGHFATLQTNISNDPADLGAGLKIDDDFTVEARFELVLPDENGEAFGIRLSDRVGTGPSAQPGDDVMELIVRQGSDGVVRVEFRERDFVAGEVNSIDQSAGLNPPDGADYILLRLEHVAGTGDITASFEYWSEGGENPLSTTEFLTTGQIFGTETPGIADDELFTRAQIIAFSPGDDQSTSLTGAYGTMSIDQNGEWTYDLATGSDTPQGVAVQALAAGEVVTDTFTAVVTDEFGALDETLISVEVTGVNDAPVIAGDLAITVDEEGTVALTTADLNENDPDDDGADLTYTTTGPTNGQLELTTNAGVAINSFTQAQLAAGLVVYVHDGSETTSDSFVVSLADGLEDGATAATAAINVTVNPQVDIITGTEDVDTLDGTTGPDIINALGSGDFINAHGGEDIVNAGEGDDLITADVNDGNDQYDGGGDTDTISYASNSADITFDLVNGTVNGSQAGSDTITQIERFIAGSGNDALIFDEDTGFYFDGGDGIDTVNVVGGIDIDAKTTDIEIENVEIVNLNKTDSNTLTLSADDISGANDQATLQIRGGSSDVVNLTTEYFELSDAAFPDEYFPEGSWIKSAQTFTDTDGTVFDVYEFFQADSTTSLATAQIEQLIDVRVGQTVIGTNAAEGLQGGFGNDFVAGLDGDDTLSGDPLVTTTGEITIPPTEQTPIPQTLAVSLTMPDASSDDSVHVSGTVSRSIIEETVVNIAFVVDVSGSTAGATLAAEIDGITALYNSIVDDAGLTNANITLIPFSGAASTAYTGPADEDTDGNGTPDFIEALNALIASGSTNFESALNQTINFFTASAAGANFVFFLSDGQDFGATFTDEVATLTDPNGFDATIRAFGLGSGASEADLDLVDDGVDNDSATIVLDPSQLSSGLIGSDVTQDDIDQILFLVDGQEVGSLDGDDLTQTPFGLRYEFEITGLDPEQANQIEVRVIATDQDQTTVSTSQTLELGGDGADIIVGGLGGDILTGGPGPDAFVIGSLSEGVDTITDFSDDDLLDLTGLLENAFNPATDDINQFVNATSDASGNTTVAVDVDGAVDGPQFTDIAVLQGVQAGVDVAVRVGEDVVDVNVV